MPRLRQIPFEPEPQGELPFAAEPPASPPALFSEEALIHELTHFREFGEATRCQSCRGQDLHGHVHEVPVLINEFWTARQRAANRLHEIAYRACFKPPLPRFFIERLTQPGDVVHDPFMGRGTTPIEAALMDRIPYGSDLNPLSVMLTRPRLRPPEPTEVAARLGEIDFAADAEAPADLLVFYHPATLREIAALRRYLIQRDAAGTLDHVDDWIRLVALNRLTGHSAGFFSVYTLPPNQATSVKAQVRINARRSQTPERRDVPRLILKKSLQLLGECPLATRRRLAKLHAVSRLATAPAHTTPQIPANSVRLVVTSPPFLNVVQYSTDNWLRCWFAGLDVKAIKFSVTGRLEVWQEMMTAALRELCRVLMPGGYVAFEVGEVAGGTVNLDEAVLPCGLAAGLHPVLVLINAQEFTKTANCWGVDNNQRGTNTNRVVLWRK